MGKPAARLTDTTAHGGSIVGPGCPMVMIGKMPAATMGDMHVCPMCTGPVPHVGGPISLGSMGVFIGKKPAARISDVSVCVGPPSMPVVGHFQTMIGEVGGAGGGGQAAMAATAPSAVSNPGSVTPMEVPEYEQVVTENHEITVEVVDSADLPLMVPYEIKDPAGAMLRGVSTVQGKIFHGGYAKAGGYEVRLKALTQCRISASKVKPGDKLQIEVLAEGFGPEESISFAVLWITSLGERLHAVLSAKVQGNKAKVDYVLPLDCGDGEPGGGDSNGNTSTTQSAYQVSGLWVMARSGQWIAVSTVSSITAEVKAELYCGKKAVADAGVKLILINGAIQECKSDSQGTIQFKDLPAGCFRLEVSQQGEVLYNGIMPSGTSKPVRLTLHRQLTIKAVAEKLVEIEGRDGFAAARDAGTWLDYKQLNGIAKLKHATQDPNLMPSRFMILQSATDSTLQAKGNLNDWPLKLHDAAKHKVSIENLVAGLKHLEFIPEAEKPDLSKGLTGDILPAFIRFLSRSNGQAPNLKGWKHAVAEGDRLSEIAARFGEASWETVLAKNAADLKDDPDRMKPGMTLSMPEREHPWLKWFEEEGYDPVFLGGGAYQYPWQYISLTLVDNEGKDLEDKEFPMDVTLLTQSSEAKSTGKLIAKLTLKKANELFFMSPRYASIEVRTPKAIYVYTPPSNAAKKSADSSIGQATDPGGMNPDEFQNSKVTLV